MSGQFDSPPIDSPAGAKEAFRELAALDLRDEQRALDEGVEAIARQSLNDGCDLCRGISRLDIKAKATLSRSWRIMYAAFCPFCGRDLRGAR